MLNQGRPRKPGERYPGGKLRSPETTMGKPIDSALWERIKRDAIARASDPRAGNEVGRLNLHKHLTNPQAVAAMKVAEIYGAFERLEGISRSCRSASYETGRGRGGIDEGRLTRTELDKLIEAQDAIKTAFLNLSDEMAKYPKWMRDVIETLCVEDRAILPIHFANVRAMLDNLTRYFGKKRAATKPNSHGVNTSATTQG